MTLYMAGFPIYARQEMSASATWPPRCVSVWEMTSPITIDELEKAEHILLVGANIAVTYPVYVRVDPQGERER